MSNLHTDRVLGRMLARDLTEREMDSVSGAHGGDGCPPGTFLTDVDFEGNPICDSGDGETP